MYGPLASNIQYREGLRKAKALPKNLSECQDMPFLDEGLHAEHPPFGGRPSATWNFHSIEDTRENPVILKQESR